MLSAILEGEDDDDEDAILPPIQSRLTMADPPPVESSVANHLHPGRRTALSSNEASLPGKTEHFAASVFEKICKSSALAVCALNATFLLTAYQAELLEEMGHQLDSGSPKPALWEEICVFADLNLRTSRGAVQCVNNVTCRKRKERHSRSVSPENRQLGLIT